MNYKGIVNWLQEDGFVLMGFSDKGEITLMEKHTGQDVNNLSSFLIATVLPIAKKKIVYLLKGQAQFREVHHTTGVVNAFIYHDKNLIGEGEGVSGERAMVQAVENFIRNLQGVSDKEFEEKIIPQFNKGEKNDKG